MTDWLFVSSIGEFAGLMLIVFIASIVRGAIGFAFSALVVASSSFWLPPIAVIAMVVVLEIIASILMLKSVRGDIDYRLLTPLAIAGIPSALLGVTLLTRIEPFSLQLMMGGYLITIVLVSLFDMKFRPAPNTVRLSIVGFIAGFYNGLAGIGGIFIATFLNGSRISVKDIRATMVIYFFICEAAFFLGAYLNAVYTPEIFLTAAVAILPMIIGIQIGTHFFTRLPEKVLRRMVLIALLLVSLFGLLKYL